MTDQLKLKIVTLNVKGLNNQQKQRNTLTLLKSYKLDIIILQEIDRTSEAAPQHYTTRAQLQDLTRHFLDSSDLAKSRPFHTFFQKTQGNRTMATHLDYIFIDENNANLISQIDTRFGNSDHLLV